MLTQTIPSYLYVQYQDEPTAPAFDEGTLGIATVGIATEAITGRGRDVYPVSDLQAFVNSYNAVAQGYLDSVNSLNLPIYTIQSGTMLDWVALGLYGIQRPSLSVGTTYTPLGVYNTVVYNETAYSEDVKGGDITAYFVTDDYFKRIITWNFYNGDSFQFTIPWLKRRVKRFLDGIDGVDFPIDETYDISVILTGINSFEINVPDTEAAHILEACILQGILSLPFQYIFTVTY